MARPVVHFEILGSDPARLRDYYAELFGWAYAVGDARTEAVSAPGQYGFLDAPGAGVNGGVGGGPGHPPRALFYVGVEDVGAALARAEELGGTRVLGPEPRSGSDLVVGWFTDPEGSLVGLAGPA